MSHKGSSNKEQKRKRGIIFLIITVPLLALIASSLLLPQIALDTAVALGGEFTVSKCRSMLPRTLAYLESNSDSLLKSRDRVH